MTLCVAWIRHGQHDEGQELVFATDSRLRMGEAWDLGLKLFDLGRPDSLLCFAGSTYRAYPLILQGNNARRSNVAWSDPRLDVHDVLEIICNSFTEMSRNVSDTVKEAPPPFTGNEKTDFLFGGWSWRQQKFGIWKLTYSLELEAYIHEAIHNNDSARVFAFIGDNIDEARQLLIDDLNTSGKILDGTLDMEPLRVLAVMSRDRDRFRTIGGALQIAKVYRSGNSEFFGVMWPSNMNGKPAFLGREVKLYDAPPMRLLDPDTAGFIENLPAVFGDLESYDFGDEAKFVQDCYPDKRLNPELPEAWRHRLHRIFRDRAYREFVAQRESLIIEAAPASVDIASEVEPPAVSASVAEGEEGTGYE